MNISKLENLFELLCEDFQKLLEKDEPMSAADRKLLIEFLKDNQITCVGQNNKNIKSIVENLPFSEEVEQHRAINQ